MAAPTVCCSAATLCLTIECLMADPAALREPLRIQAQRLVGEPVVAASAAEVSRSTLLDGVPFRLAIFGILYNLLVRRGRWHGRLRETPRAFPGRLPNPAYLVLTDRRVALFPFVFGVTTTLGPPRTWLRTDIACCADLNDPYMLYMQVRPDRRPLVVRVLNDGPNVQLLLRLLNEHHVRQDLGR
jgi:hypothetical protein